MSNNAKKRLYVGGEGSGKTTLALYEARKEKHLFILDLNRQESTANGSDVVIALRDAKQAAQAVKDALRGIEQRGRYHITWHVPPTVKPRDALDFVIRAIGAIGGMALLIDETESFIPAREKLSEYVFIMAKRGRHISPMPLYMTCHKPTEINNVVRTNVYSMSFFDQFDNNSLNFFIEKCARYHTKREAVNLLNTLGKYEYILMENGKKPKKMKKCKNT